MTKGYKEEEKRLEEIAGTMVRMFMDGPRVRVCVCGELLIIACSYGRSQRH